ncbi:TPA: HTH domain-containing protein [Staphylococcus aureus]|uniref:helix-turn-helix transcriptional regulator n=1 Tax=Staphylococcus aureus TaxID=1280 RepID=UPI0009433F06|nr:HTH domain-containing protein [Staphylococcus aureus]AVR99854.1 HTH domain-containing protein [Staphylococcus aureus]MBY0878099.1 HTH domain-containing protein [Staphylococcus aureus]MCQ9892556.1 HTH domain-containing protein [Staphylococcus aureus]MCQ9898364.1 HTH domain-containing protein [Staphylococcus aureus]MCQ9912533.1 HTH domain-containing protein [Staphylococcus aureus]
MKKSVRLYNMIEYCNENRNFKLNDLMSEFNISRSTALRDIKEIEALGVPLYSNPGKNGGYTIIGNRDQTKIAISDEELKALVFTLSSISNVSNLPFQTEYQEILKKLYNNSNKKELINQYNDLFQYFNEDKYQFKSYKLFNEIIRLIIENKSFETCYSQNYIKEQYKGIGIMYKNHQWYFVAANIESKLVNLLNISKIKELYEMGETQECNDITMQNFQQFMVKNETAIDILIRSNVMGLNILKGYLWSDYMIENIDEETYLFKSKVNAKDIDFIAKLIVTGGVNVKVETPNSLKNAVKVELTKIINMY